MQFIYFQFVMINILITSKYKVFNENRLLLYILKISAY